MRFRSSFRYRALRYAETFHRRLWTVHLTKSQASGKPLLIPARIVRNNLSDTVNDVIIKSESGDEFPCRLLRYERNRSEVLLGNGWKQFCLAQNLTRRHVVNFEFVAAEIPVIHAVVDFDE